VRPIVAACALLPALAVPARAWPADALEVASPAWLAWDPAGRDEGCPSAAELEARVGQLLGHSPAQSAAESGRRIVLRVERQAGNPLLWSAEATMVDAQGAVVGKRRIRKPADSCAPISDALALIVVLSLSNAAPSEPAAAPPAEPARLLSPPVRQPATAAREEATRSREVPPAPAAPATVRHRWALAIDAGLAASAGMLPNPSPGAQGRVRISPPAWPVLYTSFTLWKQETRYLPSGPAARLDLWTLGLGACRQVWTARPLSFELCGGAEAGRIRASGFGIAANVDKEAAGWFVDLAAGGVFEGRIARGLLAGIALQLAVPLTRTRVVFHDPSNGDEVTNLWRIWSAFPLTFVYAGYAFQ
jgi:hypothetical protein